jgi:hypothetical protein
MVERNTTADHWNAMVKLQIELGGLNLSGAQSWITMLPSFKKWQTDCPLRTDVGDNVAWIFGDGTLLWCKEVWL